MALLFSSSRRNREAGGDAIEGDRWGWWRSIVRIRSEDNSSGSHTMPPRPETVPVAAAAQSQAQSQSQLHPQYQQSAAGFYSTSTPIPASCPNTQPPPAQQQLQWISLARPPNAVLHGASSTQESMVGVQNVPADVQRIERPETQNSTRVMKKPWWLWQSSTSLQTQILTVLIAGIFLAITLSIYLGLALRRHLQLKQEWHVLLILIILIATMFFCHALVRLCILATNPKRFRQNTRSDDIERTARPGGYVHPRVPIRINDRHEDDVTGDLNKSPDLPPVYGLWRCTMRVDPNGFYWVRRTSIQENTHASGSGSNERRNRTSSTQSPTSPQSPMSPRPPSYTSDDGVSYALNAHTGTTTRYQPSLPTVPSGSGRT